MLADRKAWPPRRKLLCDTPSVITSHRTDVIVLGTLSNNALVFRQNSKFWAQFYHGVCPKPRASPHSVPNMMTSLLHDFITSGIWWCQLTHHYQNNSYNLPPSVMILPDNPNILTTLWEPPKWCYTHIPWNAHIYASSGLCAIILTAYGRSAAPPMELRSSALFVLWSGVHTPYWHNSECVIHLESQQGKQTINDINKYTPC